MIENLPPIELDEIADELLPAEEYHRQQATRLFDFAWALLEQEERSPDETDAMINASHAARFHWSQLGTPLHVAYSEWQISRVYCAVGRPEPALYHAGRCLAICQQAKAGHFALAYAYEALARAHAVAGLYPEADRMVKLSKKAGVRMQSRADKGLLARDLMTIPGVERQCEEQPTRAGKRSAGKRLGITNTQEISNAAEQKPIRRIPRRRTKKDETQISDK